MHIPSKQGAKLAGFGAVVCSLHDLVRATPIVSNNVVGLGFEAASVLSADQSAMLADSYTNVKSTLETFFSGKMELTPAMEAAAVQAAFIGSDVPSYLKDQASIEFLPVGGTKTGVVVNSGTEQGGMSERIYGFETYDNKLNETSVAHNIMFNVGALRQETAANLFYPAIVIDQKSAGFTIDVNLAQVLEMYEHKVGAGAADFKKKLLVRAYVDNTILRSDQTTIYPVYRAQDAASFVAVGTLPARTIEARGQSFQTNALKPGVTIDLLAISQTDQDLAAGVRNMTDALDPAVTLKNVYFKVGPDIMSFDVSNFSGSNFVAAPQGLKNQAIIMNFSTNSLRINAGKKTVANAALTAAGSGGLIKQIDTDNLSVRMEFKAHGEADYSIGNVEVNSNKLKVHKIVRRSTNETIPLTDPSVTDLVDALNAAEFIGYDLRAYLINSNMRERGQFLDISRFGQTFNVPLRDPITCIHPKNVDLSVDATDITNLVSAIQARMSNETISAVLNWVATLGDYETLIGDSGLLPEAFGVGRFWLQPYFKKDVIDMMDIVDSLTSTARPSDIRSALVNVLRQHAYEMHMQSEWIPAANQIYGGTPPTPCFGILTDQIIAGYLSLDGEPRTLGPGFEFEIAVTVDQRFRGKLYMTYVDKSPTRNTHINVLASGNTHYSTEVVMQGMITRGNSTSRETIMQPRYLIVNNIPVGLYMEISNMEEVVRRVPLQVNNTLMNP